MRATTATSRSCSGAAGRGCSLLNIVALAFVLLHAITWFNLAPKAMVIRMRGRRLPPRSVAAAHFAAWAVASAVVAWIVLGGP